MMQILRDVLIQVVSIVTNVLPSSPPFVVVLIISIHVKDDLLLFRSTTLRESEMDAKFYQIISQTFVDEITFSFFIC